MSSPPPRLFRAPSAESMPGEAEDAEPGLSPPVHPLPSSASSTPPSVDPYASYAEASAPSEFVHPEYTSHRPLSIVTAHLPAHRPAPAAPLPLLPSPHPPSSHPTLDHLEALVSSAPSSLPDIPLPPPPYSEAEEEAEEAANGSHHGGSTPPPTINIHYAEEDEEAEDVHPLQSSGPIGGPSPPTAYHYPDGVEEEKQEADSTYGRTTSITGTTVPYLSSGTFVPDALGQTYGGAKGGGGYALDEEAVGATLRSSIGSTTTPSPLPYNTASSLVLLSSPIDRTLSASVHSTPTHLRPSSALSLYSPQSADDVNATMKSAVSVLSYDDGDSGEPVEGGEGHAYPVAAYGQAPYQATASYQYGDVDEAKEGDREGLTVAGMGGVVEEEKEGVEGASSGGVADAQVVRVDGGDVDDVHHRSDFHAQSDIELQRATSSYADHYTHSGVQSVKVEDGLTGGVLAQVQNLFKIDVKVNVSGQRDNGVNENPEGRSRSRRRAREPAPAKTFRWPLFTAVFLTVDVLLFLIPLAWGGWQFADLIDNPMYGPDGATLLHFGAKFTPALLLHSQNWRLLVSCFLHAGIIHVLFSLSIGLMYAWSLEQEYGFYRVFPIWIISGVFSQLFSALLSPQLVSVGGGAAVAGVVGSWLADFCHTHERIVGKWNFFVRNLFTSGVLFVSGIFPFVDNWGIGAGAVMGFVVGLVAFAPFHKTREGKWKLHHPFLAVPAAIAVPVMFAVVAGVLYSQGSSDPSTYSTRGDAHYIGCVDTSYWNCHSGVPADCYVGDVFQPGSNGGGNNSDVESSGYC